MIEGIFATAAYVGFRVANKWLLRRLLRCLGLATNGCVLSRSEILIDISIFAHAEYRGAGRGSGERAFEQVK